jgi:hypothetical protein
MALQMSISPMMSNGWLVNGKKCKLKRNKGNMGCIDIQEENVAR